MQLTKGNVFANNNIHVIKLQRPQRIVYIILGWEMCIKVRRVHPPYLLKNNAFARRTVPADPTSFTAHIVPAGFGEDTRVTRKTLAELPTPFGGDCGA